MVRSSFVSPTHPRVFFLIRRRTGGGTLRSPSLALSRLREFLFVLFFLALATCRSPYVGLSVCMQAYNKVPEAQRDRLAALTGGHRDRFIGGSADTMYIPGRHRATFMSTLALFLQTNCFLEIAAPTALHLALPPDEEILFVDHVRALQISQILHFWRLCVYV